MAYDVNISTAFDRLLSSCYKMSQVRPGPDVTLVRITTKIQKNKNASFKKYGKKTCTRYISSRYVLTYDQRTQTKNERHVGTPGAPAIFSKREQDY